MLSGYTEPAHLNHFDFENQRRTFHKFGYALDPSDNSHSLGEFSYIGEKELAEQNKGLTVFEHNKVKIERKRQREGKGDPSDIEGYKGPWADYKDEVKVAKPSEEQLAILEEKFGNKQKKKEENETVEEKTMLHIDDPYDYQGRSYLHIPQDLPVDLRSDEPPHKCYIPKKLLHTWSGHSKGIASIKFFPRSAHLLLSGGMDNKIKLWEVYNQRRCIRTFAGHGKAVKEVCFNNDGTQFLSSSYDRHIKLWDTETGKCVSRFTNGKLPYCIKFNPDEDKQHLFLAGCNDKKIYTWDTKSGETVQEYDRHLGAVNTITFVDENRRFVTTSDDKSLRVWEWDTPVDMKYIAEPNMHTMPFVSLSHDGKWLACQCMDNQIMIFGVHNNFRLNRKKSFKGHMVAGYACQVNFSPDGSFVISGDADGKLNIWEWKTTRLFSKFKAHNGVCIGCMWHPHETSKVVTAGWDGLIHLWD
jgi:pre-mRNA-processing factor 17